MPKNKKPNLQSSKKHVGRDAHGRLLPGHTANPSGRAALTDEERQMRANFKSAFAMLGNKTMSEISELAKDPKQPAPIVIAAKALEWAFKKGNPQMFQQIFDRTVGKVTDTVHISGLDGGPIETADVSIAQLSKDPNIFRALVELDAKIKASKPQ